MDSQKLIGSLLTAEDRAILENLGDYIEGQMRQFSKEAVVYDQGNNPVSVRSWLFGVAWDIKSVARVGTPSYLL